MRRVIAVITVIAAAAASGYVALWIPVAAAPVLLLLFSIISGPRKVSAESLTEIKTIPYKDNASAGLRLNGNWNVSIPGSGKYEIPLPCDLATVRGIASVRKPLTFSRNVTIESIDEKQRVFLYGSGAGGEVTVYIDGTQTGEIAPGFLPFRIDITDAVDAGVEFLLSIDVATPKEHDAPGKLDGIGPQYAVGIFRELFIETVYAVSPCNVWFDRKTAGCEPTLCVAVEGETDYPTAVSVAIKDKKTGKNIFNGTEIVPGIGGRSVITFFLIDAAIKEWDSNDPQLYDVNVALVCEDIRASTEFITGCKTFSCSSGKMQINGESRTLRGVSRYEHFPPYGAAVPSWGAAKDVRSILEPGFNTVYCPDYPPHPAFWKACDEAGLHVIAEFPYRQLERTVGKEKARAIFRLETDRAVAHPCFLFWTVDAPAAQKPLLDDNHSDRVCRLHKGRAHSGHAGMNAVKLNVDMYTRGHFRKQLGEFVDSGADLLIMDYIDTAAGSESHGNRELRKASHDLETLKAADTQGLKALVLGQFFTWGLRSGVYSINRKKKASADSIKKYFESGIAAEVTTGRHTVYLPNRIPIVVLSALLACLIIVPQAGSFFARGPHIMTLFLPWWYAAAVQSVAWLIMALCMTLYFEWRRRLIPGAACILGYPLFLRLYTTHTSRSAIALAMSVWLIVIAAVVANAVAGGNLLQDALVPVMLASVFDCLAAVYLFVPVSPYILLGSSFLLQFAFLSWFFGPLGALAAAFIKNAPFAALFAWLDAKNIFSS